MHVLQLQCMHGGESEGGRRVSPIKVKKKQALALCVLVDRDRHTSTLPDSTRTWPLATNSAKTKHRELGDQANFRAGEFMPAKRQVRCLIWRLRTQDRLRFLIIMTIILIMVMIRYHTDGGDDDYHNADDEVKRPYKHDSLITCMKCGKLLLLCSGCC